MRSFWAEVAGMQPKHNAQLVPLAKQLRRHMTKEERRLWYGFLRRCPVRFSRQKVLGKYIVDFYCAQARLVIELDGSQHYEEGCPAHRLSGSIRSPGDPHPE